MIFPLLMGIFSAGDANEAHATKEKYIYTWMYDKSLKLPTMLAVLNGDPKSKDYGRLIRTVSTGEVGVDAHHTNHSLPRSGTLFTNNYMGGRSFVFDVKTNPGAPQLKASFSNVKDYTFPHSFEELPNGNTLVTFQTKGQDNKTTGGLVELDSLGRLVRAADAGVENIPEIRPYSLQILPAINRIVTTSLDMKDQVQKSRHVQVWRLSDLKLLSTIRLPEGPRGRENSYPMEPRVLSDGKTVLVSTLACAVYMLDNLEQAPTAQLVYDFGGTGCALPVVIGKYWVQTLGKNWGVGVLDLSDASKPIRVSTLKLPEGYFAHWIAKNSKGNRIVMTGYEKMSNRVAMLNFDTKTGALSIDRRFGTADDILPGFFSSEVAAGRAPPPTEAALAAISSSGMPICRSGKDGGIALESTLIPHGSVFSW